MPDWSTYVLPVLAVLVIGIAKAGFGGGLGMLATPLCVLAFGPKDAIGILLPLLCAGDAFSLHPYWGKWDRRNLLYLLPGVIVGIVLGVQLIGRFSPRELNIAIGALAVGFVLFQLARDSILRAEGTFRPNWRLGLPFGLATGVTSTFAHGAGPVVTLFLIPQRLPKELFVGTNVLIFTWVNWLKMPFFCIDRQMVDLPLFARTTLINPHTLWRSLWLLPLIPLGVWLGVWLNRRVPERLFSRVIYVITFLTGLQLLCQFDLARLAR